MFKHLTNLTVLYACSLLTGQAAAGEIFSDDFEGTRLSPKWETNAKDSTRGGFETRGRYVHSGKQSFRLTSISNNDHASGSNLRFFFLPGKDNCYFRWYAMFAPDFNQGNLMHWCVLSASRIDDQWSAFGKAGIRPDGTNFAVTNLEPANNWGRRPLPGGMGFYSYFPEMKISGDSLHYYGNRFEPEPPCLVERGRWYCFEVLVKLNEPGHHDGEQAFWIDGKEIYRQTGIRWRDSEVLKLNSLTLDVYIHHANQDNTCWFDEVVISTEYIGPLK